MTKRELGTVIRRTKGFYYLRNNLNQTVECKIKGLLFKNSRFDNQVAVGDRVIYQKSETDNLGLIIEIEPRNSFLSRTRVGKEAEQVIAANIDYLLIVAATKDPAFRFNLINRMLVAASVGRITPILVITKTDLVPKKEIDHLLAPFRDLELEYFLSTTLEPEQNPKLSKLLKNSVSVLAGQSGAGKSSLLNKYFPALSIKIGDVGLKTHKGSHTTTYTISHQIAENGFVIDTPGIREFGLWNITQANLNEYYPLIQTFQQQCKHRNCRHVHEPQCAVKDAVTTKVIHPILYDGYVSIFNSLPPR
ncbi:MAG: ribosome small subunit-dependent GTPase A [Deltaproteobacteria bacterium]|jgi:ribosome biogenesis GTPase / thiamine phosphate phosphatase|nr:ribosome small subunit-dependent GTPase A [Deltaproteobacteria bacterium]